MLVVPALFAALVLSPGGARAEAPTAIIDPTAIRFEVETEGQRWLLTVSGPGGFYARAEFGGSGPALSLTGEDGAQPDDGAYIWELRRLGAEPRRALAAVHSGAFHVVDGQTLMPAGTISEEAAPETAGTGGVVNRAPTHSGNVSIDGQLCVGQDCDEFVPLAFEAIKMYQNNAWILAIDTSDEMAADPFPSNDWQLKFNDSARLSVGGADYFGIEDRGDTGSSSTIPFRIDAGAPANSIRIDQNGRVGLGTATPSALLQVAGDAVVDGDFAAGSSRKMKHAFAPVEPRAILARLLDLPITEWSYRADSAAVRHMGPVAEEFSAAFALGRDDRHVSPVDLSGVAFAAIQGLHQVLRERDGEIQELRDSRDQLAARLAVLERLVTARETGGQ